VNASVLNALGVLSRWTLLASLGLCALPVHAQQLLLVDATYTATAQNTSSSHYRIMPLAGTPTNWRAPVDYAAGTMFVRMEVIEKPSDRKTLVTICFEGNVKTCMPYPPAYTAPGVYNFSWRIDSFWQYAMVDWTKGVQQVAVVLKTETEVEAQGDPLFYPAKMHVTVSIVPPGQTFVPPATQDDAGVPKDAGVTPPTPDAGQPDAAGTATDAGAKPDAAAMTDATTNDAAAKPDAALSRSDASTPPSDATPGSDNAGASAAAATSDAGPRHDVSEYLTSDTGCSTTGPRSSPSMGLFGLWWFAAACLWMRAATRRAHRAARRGRGYRREKSASHLQPVPHRSRAS
jgi:hypothetical protein